MVKMKISTLLEILLILVIISFAASKPINEGRAMKHKKTGVVRQEPAAVAVNPTPAPAKPDDDDDFDIFDLFDDDDEASAEEDPDDDEPEDADDDDDDDDDESAEDEDDDDAIDFFSELLGGDDDEKPKPKPTTAAPVVAAVESVAPEVVEPVVAAAVNPPKKVVDEPEIEVEVVEDEDLTEDEPEPPKIPPTRAVKPKKPTAVKPDLPPLNLQNTPALLELQAQLTGSSVKNGGTFEEVPLAKPTKPSKKKKVQKGSLKKQNAIIANTIEEDEPFVDEAEKTAPAASESPVYTLVVKKTDEKPEVVVEGPMVPVATVQKPLKKKVKGTKTTTTTTTTEAAEEDESEEYVEENEEATTLAA